MRQCNYRESDKKLIIKQLELCDPDYNCYTECQNEKPDGASTNGRSAGFHIHIGYDNPNVDDSVRLVKYFDTYVGVPSVLFDQDTRRRSLYGKAGSFRLQEWGVECRLLSAAMYATNDLIHVVWQCLQQAIYAFNNGRSLPSSNLVRNAIDTSNVDLAKDIIKAWDIKLPIKAF